MINWCGENTVAFQTNYAIYNMQLYSFLKWIVYMTCYISKCAEIKYLVNYWIFDNFTLILLYVKEL